MMCWSVPGEGGNDSCNHLHFIDMWPVTTPFDHDSLQPFAPNLVLHKGQPRSVFATLQSSPARTSPLSRLDRQHLCRRLRTSYFTERDLYILSIPLDKLPAKFIFILQINLSQSRLHLFLESRSCFTPFNVGQFIRTQRPTPYVTFD